MFDYVAYQFYQITTHPTIPEMIVWIALRLLCWKRGERNRKYWEKVYKRNELWKRKGKK